MPEDSTLVKANSVQSTIHSFDASVLAQAYRHPQHYLHVNLIAWEKIIGSQLVVSSSIQISQSSQSSYQLALPLALQNQQVISRIRSDEQAGV